MRNLRYLWYVLKHKYFVFVEGRKLGLPIWLLLMHDLSKFSRAEWGPYVDRFYGSNSKPEAFKSAWKHHWENNPHHWEYWSKCLPSPLEMPDLFSREMLADWRAAGRAQGHGDDTKDFYLKNRDRMELHSQTRAWVENQLGL